ncbi:MAG TPA: choice-of-anchor tandem repeat GloVer-containing protein [Terriglobales bacterium]|jgi:uncharacterized repeat protein (TIGR03803 family)
MTKIRIFKLISLVTKQGGKAALWVVSKVVCLVLGLVLLTVIASPAQTLNTIYSFCSQTNCTDGIWPHAGLVQGTDGNFYGTTSSDEGAYADGTVFKITPSGTLATLHTFDGADGSIPDAGLVQGADGNFYGTTGQGGANDDPSCDFGGRVGCGTVFKITPGGSLTTLYNFCSQPYCSDGSNPSATLVQGSDGNFYGTAGGQGGTVFRITPDGTLTTLYFFCSLNNCADGEYPRSLVQGTDGNFYGTTYAGGTSNNCTIYSSIGCGTVFKITPQGTLTTLHSFDNAGGCYPQAGLVQGTDGNFYGTTSGGGPSGYCGYPGPVGGTVFKITPAGILTTLYNFCSSTNCTDGDLPYGELVQATDGNFYGTTNGGGDHGNCGGVACGTVFEITPAGTLTTLYDFCSQPNCADGILPYGKLVQATDGNFYGTTYEGGTHGSGTVFRLSGATASPVQFVPVTPCRLVDTRPQYGGNGPIQGGTFRSFPILQEGGCNIPTTAAAYSLNVTVVPQGYLGFLTIWPAGQQRPGISTLNSLDGRIKADAAIVPAGSSGDVSVYVTQTTNVILDIDGYFAPTSGSTLAFYPLPPCRVADTRYTTFPPGLGSPHLSALVERDFPVLLSPCIPAGVNAQAYSFNFTAVPYPALGDPLGYLEVWPKDQMPQHPVSTLNNLTGTIVANAAIVPAGTGGEIAAFANNDTNLVIDINGYFAPAGQGGLSLYPAAPCRVIDTRQLGPPFSGTLTPPVDVSNGPCGPPAAARAYVFNATVVPPGALGYLTLWPDGIGRPLQFSTLNAIDGWITSNMAIVSTTNGKVDAYASGLTQLILDISSYFAP